MPPQSCTDDCCAGLYPPHTLGLLCLLKLPDPLEHWRYPGIRATKVQSSVSLQPQSQNSHCIISRHAPGSRFLSTLWIKLWLWPLKMLIHFNALSPMEPSCSVDAGSVPSQTFMPYRNSQQRACQLHPPPLARGPTPKHTHIPSHIHR